MKHHVVLFDWGLYPSLASGTEIVGIAHSPEKAKEILATASVDEKAYAKKHDWEVLVDSDVEFSARDISDGNNEYAHFYIKEVDATDDDVAYDCSTLLNKGDVVNEN